MGRIDEARAGFSAMTQLRPNDSRGWTGAGALELAAGNLAAAASAYERALAIAPASPIAANGVARVAMQRGEPDALARYEAALRLSPGDRNLIRDSAELRSARGDADALAPLAAAVRAAPEWMSGQMALARLRWERGDKNGFRDEIEARLKVNPADTQLWFNYVDLLEACGLDAEAAETARRAREAGADRNRLMLSEAIHAGRAGDLARAESLFATLPPSLPGRSIHESIHWIRQGEFDRALVLAEAALRDDPWSISYWGVIELLYRKTGHARAEWLSGQEGLVATFALPLARDRFEAVDALCLRLHRESVECIGQSVRAGTQTRWNLFDRREPELAELHRALDALVADYLAALPPRDETHPLLRHKGRPLKITTSWSIRLTGPGYHVSHFHPKGLVSSACYLRVPETNEETCEGWLELGLPPDDFAMPLDPLISVQPEPGRLALFPSYLLHGTRRFSAGERMSVAFDVAPA
jgi:tetratricopeptide (TPR) repeat protein